MGFPYRKIRVVQRICRRRRREPSRVTVSQTWHTAANCSIERTRVLYPKRGPEKSHPKQQNCTGPVYFHGCICKRSHATVNSPTSIALLKSLPLGFGVGSFRRRSPLGGGVAGIASSFPRHISGAIISLLIDLRTIDGWSSCASHLPVRGEPTRIAHHLGRDRG